MRSVLRIALLAALLAAPSPARAEEPLDPDVDHVQLAAVLARDGHYERAARALERVELGAILVEERALYETLSGLVALERGQWAAAAVALERAIALGQTDPAIYVHLAQARYGERAWGEAVRAIEAAGPAGERLPKLMLLGAAALTEMREWERAWAALARGASLHPSEPGFERAQMFVLVELGLYAQAAELGARYFARGGADAGEYLAVGVALARAGAPARAAMILERARLAFPRDAEVGAQLARAHAAAGRPLAAAELMQRLAERDASLFVEAAELMRRAGQRERALYLNTRVVDQRAKFRQRASILIDDERFDAVVALTDRLERLALTDDAQLVYALAYAHFKVGSWDEAERFAARVTDPQLFGHAAALRRAIAACRAQPEGCAW